MKGNLKEKRYRWSPPPESLNSILLHSGLNPAWHFWLSTRFSCCLKMKSVENILEYFLEQFSRRYTKMFKTDSFLCNKKLSLNQNVWRDHATMQKDVWFWWYFYIELRLKNEKNILWSSSRAFSYGKQCCFLLSTKCNKQISNIYMSIIPQPIICFHFV